MTPQDTKYEQFEEALLKGMDSLIEKAESQGEKALYNLFKSAILKKYKYRYDADIQQGEVKKDAVDKSRDFLFEDTCVRFRALPDIDYSIKEDVIHQAKASLDSWKSTVTQMLTDSGIYVV